MTLDGRDRANEQARIVHALRSLRDRITELESAKTATRWIAELGGYTGKSSGGPPGATVLRRGLDRLHTAVEAAVALLGLDDDTCAMHQTFDE